MRRAPILYIVYYNILYTIKQRSPASCTARPSKAQKNKANALFYAFLHKESVDKLETGKLYS